MGLAVGGLQGGSSGGAGSSVTLAPVGAAPNADGATLTFQQLNLEPADATHPGVVTSGTQTVGGAKTFAAAINLDLGITTPAGVGSGAATNLPVAAGFGGAGAGAVGGGQGGEINLVGGDGGAGGTTGPAGPGGNVFLNAGFGGDAGSNVAGSGGNGGVVQLVSGTGGNTASAATAGAGGLFSAAAGAGGGSDPGGGGGGAGGVMQFVAGTGGYGDAGQAGANGGALTILSGTAGAEGAGGATTATAGVLTIDTGAPRATGSAVLFLGSTNAKTMTIGRSGATAVIDSAVTFTDTVALNGVTTATQQIEIQNQQLLLTNSSLQMTTAGTPMYNSGGVMIISGNPTDGGTAVALELKSAATLSNAGAKLVSVVNNAAEQAYVLFDGSFFSNNSITGQSLGITTKGNSTGSPGDATLNTGCGRSKIAAGVASCTITNSRVLGGSQIMLTNYNGDATCASIYVSSTGAGAFTVSAYPAAPTADFGFGWFVIT